MQRRLLLSRSARLVQAAAAIGSFAALQACSKEEPVASSSTAASAPATPASSGALTPSQAYELAATGSGFTIGPVMAANTVYVFFDPQCPHCAALWQACAEVGGRFRMQWMPVAFLARISQPQGAAIISAKDPAALMNENESMLMQRKGGLDVSQISVPKEALDKVAANTELLKKLGADSVPMIFYKNQRTGEAGSHSGALPLQSLLQLVGAG